MGLGLEHLTAQLGETVVATPRIAAFFRRRRIFEPQGSGAPDGLAVDEEGCVWVAMVGGGRIDLFTPDGRTERSVEVPAVGVTSLCFAGSDRRDLIAVSMDNARHPERAGSIFRTRVDVAGVPIHLARI